MELRLFKRGIMEVNEINPKATNDKVLKIKVPTTPHQ